ncbi:MAG: DUF2007 domain-containing protein [Prevotellaceae bacterium]|jgi:hypothetical protein|nr:DUF2007 domain-containing protein [Prevotellaceae bacterium]
MENDKTIIYKSYDLLYDAVYARDTLKENGIEAFISDEGIIPLSVAVSASMGGTKLHIFEKDMKKVKEILNDY